MKIVILGSTGQVGSYVTEKLKKDFPDAEILACARRQGNGYFLFNPFINDWSKLGKVDILVNSVGIIEEKDGMTFEKAHQQLTGIILKNREVMGYPKLIQLSALGADTRSKVAYMYTKALADEELLGSGNSAIVRPSIVCTHNTAIVQKFRMIKKISRLMMGFLPFPHVCWKLKCNLC